MANASDEILRLFTADSEQEIQAQLLAKMFDPTVVTICGLAISDQQKKNGLRQCLHTEDTETLHQNAKRKKLNLLQRSNMKFTVNGEIRDPSGLFFLLPPLTDQLVDAIYLGKYIMFQGHRGSGKTTHCWYAIENTLQEFTGIWISMQAGIPVNSVADFWNGFGQQLTAKAKALLPSITTDVHDAQSFCLLFAEVAKNDLPPIVLFLDEFDLLLDGAEAVRVELFNALRGMKPERDREKKPYAYGLQAVVIVGPLSILAAGRVAKSPFNSSDEIACQYWTNEVVKDLFTRFSAETRIQLDQGIIDDIYERTQGHPALTCFCGKVIHETLARGKNSLDLSTWQQYALFQLPLSAVHAWTTVGFLKDFIKTEPYFSFLIRYFLYSDQPASFATDVAAQEIARILTSHGALKLVDNASYSFAIPSPLIRSIILQTVASFKKLRKPLPNYLPINKGQLDVPRLLEECLRMFDPSVMVAAVTYSWKNNECVGDARVNPADPVPKENCYHVELITAMRQWLPSTWDVATEVNAAKDKCDIVISQKENNTIARYAIELVAHARDGPSNRKGTVEEHFVRAESSYAALQDVKETWVVDFTTRRPEKGYKWPGPGSVKAAHVWHTLDWTRASLVFSADITKVVSLNLTV